MKRIYLSAFALIMSSAVCAQSNNHQWNKPVKASEGKAPLRTEFVSYSTRPDADTGNPFKATYFIPLNMFQTENQFRAVVDIPFMWLDRDVFLHVEGLSEFAVAIGDKKVGFSQDSKTPSEFNISSFITDGRNTIAITPGGNDVIEASLKNSSYVPKNIYIYAQPKLRIENYHATAQPDTVAGKGRLNIDIAVANSYNTEEDIVVGYDIYSPAGKMLYYNYKEVKLDGKGHDTVRFSDVYKEYDQLKWSAEDPKLCKMMLYLKIDGRFVEYIPFTTGFGKTEFDGKMISRNGKAIAIKAARYNAAEDIQTTAKELSTLKKHSINTIYVDYPQPIWFYDICNAQGLYVVDQANINSDSKDGNMEIGGAASNDPRLTDSYVERAEAMMARTRNHVCVIAWSLGGNCGNGYNMYKSYQALKKVNDNRPVIFRDVNGEWNSDMQLPEAVDAYRLLATPTPAQKPKTAGKR